MGLVTTRLTKPQLRDLLGVGMFGLRRLLRQRENFPTPQSEPPNRSDFYADADDGEPTWDGATVYRWAANDPDFAHRGAVLLRPTPEHPEPGRRLRSRDTAQGPAIDWHTDVGTVRTLHSSEGGAASAAATDLAAGDNPDDIVTVCALYGDIGFTGPALVAADTAHPGIEYEAAWGRVVDLAGTPLPWWPDPLRLPELVLAWEPGAEPVTLELPPSDREKTLRRAARNTAFVPSARAALTDMAAAIREARLEGVTGDIDIFGGKAAGRRRARIVVAAHPDTRPDIRVDDEGILADGWTAIAASADPDAVAALEVALDHSPRLLPYGVATDAPAGAEVVERWARRLTVCDPTAAHAALARDKSVDAFFVDPLTDMPALRTHAEGTRPARWLFYAPRALPAAGAELVRVTLHGTVWVTTSDDLVHPAPCDPGHHLWWGDGWGDRPTETAYAVHQLLDDAGARVTFREHWDNAPQGLTDLLNEEHPAGAELTRATLLHARMTPPDRDR